MDKLDSDKKKFMMDVFSMSDIKKNEEQENLFDELYVDKDEFEQMLKYDI